ncbi:MAG: YdcF family protein [Chitinophagaceae bacterium]|nr:YdcF family protein [Polaromonas sp.]
MDVSELKPLLTTLALPPLSLLLLALLGGALAMRGRRRVGGTLAFLAVLALGVLSCHGMAVWLARTALPQFAPLSLPALQAARVEAIVVLGGGVLPEAPEYGQAQLGPHTAARLRYGLYLARRTGLPVAFSGGMGLGSSSAQSGSEAEVAARLALAEHGALLRWLEADSRDTAGNARLTAPLLLASGVQRIALVTDAWHMPRAMHAFSQSGLTVTPAPIGFVLPLRSALLEWLPSASGLQASSVVLREVLAGALSR